MIDTSCVIEKSIDRKSGARFSETPIPEVRSARPARYENVRERSIAMDPLHGPATGRGHSAAMQYDPFAARNLVRAISLAGLLVMMTETMPGTACLGIGLFCLMSAAILSLFSGRAETASTMPRAAAAQAARPVPSFTPQAPARTRHPPGKAPAKPAVEPHPAIFSTVAGRTTGLSSSRRRD